MFFFRRLYFKVVNSISFYPSLFIILFLLLSWFCLYLDSLSIAYKVLQWVPFLIVRNPETARSVLSVLAGGIISLMVFSFSMVMIVLNQTASSYSPRVLPGLVRKREHQLVLGIYLGTIGYTLAVLSNVDSHTFSLLVPRFSIVVNLILGLCCFLAFIYFIHDISSNIQIGNILKRLYLKSNASLERELASKEYELNEIAFDQVHVVKAWQSGYFFTVVENALLRGAAKHALKVKVLRLQGQYVLEGEPLVEMNQPLNDETKDLLMKNFVFRHQEIIDDNYYYGFKQITEVAVKALSPGINDPGTALQAIDYLMPLFKMLMCLKGRKVIRSKEGKAWLIYRPVAFTDIFYFCISSMRTYAAEDVAVQAKLIQLISRMKEEDREQRFGKLFTEELEAIEEIAGANMKSHKDLSYIRRLIGRV